MSSNRIQKQFGIGVYFNETQQTTTFQTMLLQTKVTLMERTVAEMVRWVMGTIFHESLLILTKVMSLILPSGSHRLWERLEDVQKAIPDWVAGKYLLLPP